VVGPRRRVLPAHAFLFAPLVIFLVHLRSVSRRIFLFPVCAPTPVSCSRPPFPRQETMSTSPGSVLTGWFSSSRSGPSLPPITFSLDSSVRQGLPLKGCLRAQDAVLVPPPQQGLIFLPIFLTWSLAWCCSSFWAWFSCYDSSVGQSAHLPL
jgi:hypothetical protein